MSDYVKYRLLEIIPGALVWLTFALAIVLSFTKPLWAIYFILVFDFFWLMRVVYLQLFLVASYRKFKKASKINWLAQCQKNAEWENIYHLIILPTYKESLAVLFTTFESLSKSNYPLNKFIVVLACEEKDKINAISNAEEIKKAYDNKFFKLIVTLHPGNVPGEIAGKGSNTSYAGKIAKSFIDNLNIAYDKVIVSTFDIDTCVHSEYFGNLTNTYLNHPNPTHASYQPIALFNNNTWEAPALMRIVSNSTTFWLMTDTSRPERLFTFSSHSMSFKALVDVDFWQNDIVSEDSRIFLQCFLRYDGDYEVCPLYIPVSMDTVNADTLWESFKNQYKQQRRWAWGVEHFPYMAWYFFKNKKIPLLKKFRYLWNQEEGMYTWAVSPILIFLLGNLPLRLLKNSEKTTALAQTAPNLLQWLMLIATAGLIIIAIFSTFMLPPRPNKIRKSKKIEMLLQWILFPLTTIFFGSLPAIDAQTRLMFGKYLGFNVTKKFRK